MNDLSRTVMAGIIFFTSCLIIYKAVNIVDACARAYIVRRYRVYVEDYPAIPLDRFFEDEDWD